MTLARSPPSCSYANTERRSSAKPLLRLLDFPLGQDRGAPADPHAPLCRKRDFPAILDTAPARPDRADRGRHDGGRSRARAVRRHGATRHSCRDRRRRPRFERTSRDSGRVTFFPLSGHFRHALRRGPDRRSPRSPGRPRCRADEPAVLGDGERFRPHARYRVPSHRLGPGASCRWRPAHDIRRKLLTRRFSLARRPRPIAGTQPRGVHRRDRRRGLCQARHHHRNTSHRYRQGAGR